MMATTTLNHDRNSRIEAQITTAHVVNLSSYVPPHQVQAYTAWAEHMGKLTILVSTPMEKHRNWHVDWGDLDVQVQRTVSIQRRWKHTTGFTENIAVHIPWDTNHRLKQLQPDIVISGELGFRSLAAAIYCKRRPRVPLILWACVSEHTEQGRGWLRGRLRKWLVRQADAIIVNGASGRRYIEGLGCPRDRIFEIPYTCPTGTFDLCPEERDETASHRLICVGQLIERKGVDLFLPALIAWANSNPERSVELRVVGSGPLEEKLKALTLPSNLTVEFAGWRPFDQLPDEYAKSGILVFPTLADEWGLVVNEAMSAGLPILGSVYSASVEELCTEGKTAWVFHPDRPEEIYSAIDKALTTSTDRLNQMRVACRLRMKEVTAEICAATLARLLDAQLKAVREEQS